MIGQFQWINGYEDKHSNPVYKHAKNPNKWEVKSNRLIMSYYGDGGAIFTDDENLAAVLQSIRVHGEGIDKYLKKSPKLSLLILLEKLGNFFNALISEENVNEPLTKP